MDKRITGTLRQNLDGQFFIYVPSAWVRDHGLFPGAILEIEFNDTLTVKPRERKREGSVKPTWTGTG